MEAGLEALERRVRGLEEENAQLKETIRVLRRDLADPPGDIQEAVLKKFGFLPEDKSA
jgi:hypothetical protein